MAMAMNTGGQGGSRGRRGRYRPLAEINVTPLVDVMLVLLIIFMVTAPLMTSGVSVDLPKTNAQPLNSDSEPLTVTIKADGTIFLQDQGLRTLMVGLTLFNSRYRHDVPIVMAGMLIAAVPMVMLYLAGQRFFIRGLTAGGVKG